MTSFFLDMILPGAGVLFSLYKAGEKAAALSEETAHEKFAEEAFAAMATGEGGTVMTVSDIKKAQKEIARKLKSPIDDEMRGHLKFVLKIIRTAEKTKQDKQEVSPEAFTEIMKMFDDDGLIDSLAGDDVGGDAAQDEAQEAAEGSSEKLEPITKEEWMAAMAFFHGKIIASIGEASLDFL
jgi:hypothetical protein